MVSLLVNVVFTVTRVQYYNVLPDSCPVSSLSLSLNNSSQDEGKSNSAQVTLISGEHGLIRSEDTPGQAVQEIRERWLASARL